MTGFATAYAAWLDYHRANGFAVDAFLNPPASDAAIAAVAQAIGFDLPDDLVQLWQRANGQVAIFTRDDPAPGTILSPFFGGYEWCSTDAALSDYRSWQEVLAENPEGMDESITVRGDEPVRAVYWQPGWLAFARDGGGNSYAVDLSPPGAGAYGQVILSGPDEDERRVLAPGIAAFMADAAARRPPLDHSQGEPPHVFFEMEA